MYTLVKVYFLSSQSVESMSIAKQILENLFFASQSHFSDKNPLIITSKSNKPKANTAWSSVTVKDNVDLKKKVALTFHGRLNCQYVYIQEGSLNNLHELTISNLPQLQLLVVERFCLNDVRSLSFKSRLLL